MFPEYTVAKLTDMNTGAKKYYITITEKILLETGSKAHIYHVVYGYDKVTDALLKLEEIKKTNMEDHQFIGQMIDSRYFKPCSYYEAEVNENDVTIL